MLSFPDNVHKHIAEFIEPTKIECFIRMQQFAGCPQGTHSSLTIKECPHCSNIYSKSYVFILLKKGGCKKLFHKYIDIIREKITQDDTKLKSDYSYYNSPIVYIKDLFTLYYVNTKDRFTGPEPLLPWETNEYEEKYVIKGIKWALFHHLKNELYPVPNFYISMQNCRIKTVTTRAGYHDIVGAKNVNPLRAINKLYNKYCK